MSEEKDNAVVELKAENDTKPHAVGLSAAGLTAYPALPIMQLRFASYSAAVKMNQGMWPLMTPEERKLALLYYDTAFWNSKLAFVQWLPYGLPAVALFPGMAYRFGKDLKISAERFNRLCSGKNHSEDVWESMHGAQTQRYNSKAFRFISTASLFAFGAAVVASGGIGSDALLAQFAASLDSSTFTNSALGEMAGGTYGGVTGQYSAKHISRIWHKLHSGLPFKVIGELNAEQQEEICQKLSLYYFSSPCLSWFNKIRIRLATGDSYLPAKAWVAGVADNKPNGAKIEVDGRYYRVDRRLHTYRGTGSILGLVAGVLLGSFFLGLLGAIIFGYIGYRLGSAFGAFVSYHQSPYDDDDPKEAQDINQALYEHLEHVKYKITQQNPFIHLLKNYYKRAFEYYKPLCIPQRVAATFFTATFALILESVKLALIYPFYTIWYNLFQHAWPELAAFFKNNFDELCNPHSNDEENHSRIKIGFTIFVKIIVILCKLPSTILGFFVALLNPFSQSEYYQENQQLENEKKWLKTELNSHTLSPEANEHHNHIRRYRDHIDSSESIDDKKPTLGCLELVRGWWSSGMSFLCVASPKREREERAAYKGKLLAVIPSAGQQII